MSDLARAEAAQAVSSVGVVLGFGERVRASAPLVVVLGVFLVVSTVYNVRVPLYEAPDEIAHARYVRTIAEKGELPRFSSLAESESWQPPLYYAAGAGVLKVFGLESPPELEWNPSFQWNPDLPGHRSNFLHTSEEDFPYSEPVLAVHLLRGLNTLFAAGTVVLIYLTALVIFPRRRLLAFCSGATASLMPQFAFISASVSNDPAAFFFCAATVYLGLRYLRAPSPTLLALAALTIALGALTKLNTVAMAVVPVAAALLQPIIWRQKIAHVVVLIVVPVIIAGWFYIRSLILWGAIYPADMFWPPQPHPIWHEDYRQIFVKNLSETFWYAGGATSIRLSPIIYQVLDATAVLALAGTIVTFVSARLTRFQKQALTMLSVLPILALGMILYFCVTQDFIVQGRHAFTAMPAFAILPPLGIAALFSRGELRDHTAMLAAPALLLAVNISIFTVTLPRYY